MEFPLKDLSLSKDEENELILNVDNADQHIDHFELCLVGRFLMDRSFNFNVMCNRMASIWRPGKGICIKDIGSHRYLFKFFHRVDMQRVLDEGPWTFDNNLLILHQLVPGEVPSILPLFYVEF